MTFNNSNNDSCHFIRSVCMPNVLPLIPLLLSFIYSTNTQTGVIGLERESGVIRVQPSKKFKISLDCKNLLIHQAGRIDTD